jgi:aminoglycoside phosphotransferase (APT) family kinase protein
MLILNGIKHVDLHPGNVLVDGTGQVFLLDFDKAFFILNDENSPFLLSLKEQAHAPDSQNMLSSREIMREVLFLRRLRDFYLRRWRRAVIKHGLPDYVSETMCLRLRSIPLLDVGV